MNFFLRLATAICALSSSGQIVAQVPTTGEVPDDSVVAKWSATFQTVFKARETFFANFVLPAAKSPRTYSDTELISGINESVPDSSEIPHVSDMPKLEGAEDCILERNPYGGGIYYKCFFRAHGNSAVDWQNDYVRLVRLVEKATGGKAHPRPPSPDVSTTQESRAADVLIMSDILRIVFVEEHWFKMDKPEAARKWRSGLSVGVLTAPRDKTTASVSGGDEIDEVIKSGRYSQMPPSQRVGSTGSGLVSIKITNDTSYSLSLLYVGAASKSMTIPAGETATIELPPGSYRELGRVSAPNILPFIGNEVFGAGDSLVSRFFIQ
jgi:hypothetical protein